MDGQKVLFRVDASIEIGTGHVMRCLTLANELARVGARCVFLCREFPGHMGDKILVAGHELQMLRPANGQEDDGRTAHSKWLGLRGSEDARECRPIIEELNPDWLVIDHYGLDLLWQDEIGGRYQTLVIDDLADRQFRCDILLDQNLGREPSSYTGLVDSSARRLIGPEYALLRPEFSALRDQSLARRKGSVSRVNVALGGIDKDNLTAPILMALAEKGVAIDIVLGAASPFKNEVAITAEKLGAKLHVATNRMAELLCDADLAIGAAGTTSWERCALGVPSIIIVLADNQREAAVALEQAGAALVIASPDDLSAVFDQMRQGTRLLDTARNAAAITDGRGATRVLEAMT